MRLELSTTLPVAPDHLMRELSRTASLQEIAAPMLSFEPVGALAELWQPGQHRFRLLLGGRVPIGPHTINLVRIADPEALPTPDQVVWHDAGFSDLIRSWDHRIRLVGLVGSGTRYTDLVEIHAGPLTLPAWLFARAFYAHRQRRLFRQATAWARVRRAG